MANIKAKYKTEIHIREKREYKGNMCIFIKKSSGKIPRRIIT